MATIQKRKNKNGTYSYKVMIRPQDGLPATYKSFPTYQEAKDWAIQEEATRRQGVYFPDKHKKKHIVQELIDRYIELILPSIKSKGDVLRQLNWWKGRIGKYGLNHITPDLIAQHRKQLLEEETTHGRTRTTAIANRYMSALSSVLTYGVKECGWISSNPMLKVSKLREPRGRDRTLIKEECDRLLSTCSQSKNHLLVPIVTLAVTTGMRLGEIIGLTWENVDFEQRLISLKETKNGRPRSIPLVEPCSELLKTLFVTRNPHVPYVFPSKRWFGTIDIRKAWKEALKRAGIHNLKFHDLRHTFSSFAAKAGATNLELATAMGHQTLAMLQRYTHLDVHHTRRLSESVATVLLERGGTHGFN